MKKADVVKINVPQYDELSVKVLWPDLCKDPDFMQYFPDKYPAGRGPPRKYFFDILNTLQPEYLQKVMAHASSYRMAADGEMQKEETIAISKFWEEELKAMPYLSCKYHSFVYNNILIFLYREERQDDPPPQAELEEDHRQQEAEEGRHPGHLHRVHGIEEVAAGEHAAGPLQFDVQLAAAAIDPRPPVEGQGPGYELERQAVHR